MYRIIPFYFLLFVSASLLAQNPEHIRLDSSGATSGSLRSCTDQFAGTWSRGPLTGFSNDVANQVMYLCGGDAMQLVGGRDADLSGDPVTTTPPGIAYAFYECLPTVTGPTRDDILADPCLAEVNPPAAEGIVAARGNMFGDITINNNGNLQNLFGGGGPVQLWFAPITVDNFAGLAWEGSPAGQCIHSNVDVAFSYVYLNPISIGDIMTPDPTALTGNFTVAGGLPEFDGSNYSNIIIELVSNPATTGTITGSGFTHNSTVSFTVPVAGEYRIRVVDGKACPAETIVSMPRNAVNICVSDPVEVPLGEDFCIDISLSNAINIVSFQFAIGWNPAILQFLDIEVIDPSPINQFDRTNFGLDNEANPQSQGSLRVLWLTEASNPNGFTINNETTIFRICFRAIGAPGDSTAINVTDLFQFSTEFTNNSNNSVDINVKNGGAKIIDPTSIQIIDRVCSSSTNQGSIEVAAFGGTGPYSIEIEPPVGVPFVFNMVQEGTFITLNNLTPGTYTVTIRDAAGGVAQYPIIVAPTNRLSVDINMATNPSCSNRSDGSISVTPSGGTEPYRYNWSNGASGFNNIRALASGTYQVTVTDLRGCTAIASANLFKAPLTVSLTPTNPACSGTNNGAITANATSGNTGQIFYEWSTGSFNQTVSNLGAGTYTVTVEDSRQCTAVETITLVADKTITVEIDTITPLCAGDSSGSVTIRLTEVGGTPGTYNFSWNPVIGDQTNAPRESTLSNIPAGSYSVVATNAEGCRVNQTIVVDNPAGMIINRVTGVSSDCEEGSSTGGITLAVSGGTGGKTYVWNDGEFTGNSLSNVPPGAYTVTVTDQNGCTADSVFYVGPFAGFQITPESCDGNNDGAINSIIEFDDDFTISVLWSNGATTNNISGLGAGTYTVTITGSSPNIPEDCILIFEVEVPIAERFTITENHIDPTCPGDSDGVIRINVVGGNGPFTYQWGHDPANTNELFNQRGGVPYTVRISDDSGCAPLTFEIELNQPDLIMFSFASITGVSCSNTDCDGSAVLSLSGGSVPGGNFNVSWNDNTEIGVTTLTLTDLCFGENRVDVSDERGCLANSTVPVPGPDPIRIDEDNSIVEDVSCNGDTDGQVQLAAAGGNGVFTYNWPDLGQTGPDLSNLAPGIYNVIITDGNDCVFETEVTIGEPDPLVLVIDTDNTMSVGCAGADDGMIALVTVGGNPGIQTYTWTPNVSTSEIATNLSPGIYTATVTDSKGCTDDISYVIETPQPIVVDIPTPNEPLCNGLETFIEVAEATGGSGGPFRFSVNNGPLIPVGTPFPSLAGNITVQIFDARGCSLDTSFVINQPPPIVVDLGDDIEMDLGDTIQINPLIIPGAGPYGFSWSPGLDLSCIDCPVPDAFPINSTNVTLVVTDENGCTGTDIVNLRVLKRRLVYIPTGFTPNNDGINDVLEVFTGKGVSAINHMRVYDRWGNMMFERENLNFNEDGSDGWNGEYRGRAVEPGVYIYTVEVEFIDEAVLLYRGEVNIYR